MRTFDSIIRTTSNLVPSVTFDRIVAAQLFSSMTLVVGKQSVVTLVANTALVIPTAAPLRMLWGETIRVVLI